MSRKTITVARRHLWLALAAATLAGCASAPAPSSEEPSTATLSGPPEVPVVGCNAATLRQSVLQRLNQARAAGAVCGDAKQAAAKALVWQPALAAAASRRASEMAQRGSFGARDPRGTEQRLRQEGYRAVVAQENSAAGDYTSDTVAQTWLSHQQQCMALTNPAYTDVGAGCASAPGSEWGHYWTVVVAKPGDGPAPKAVPGAAKAKPKAKARSNVKSKAKPKAKPPAASTRANGKTAPSAASGAVKATSSKKAL